MTKKVTINVRLTDEERAALQAASEAKSIALSSLIRMVLVEWLRKHGWLRKRP